MGKTMIPREICPKCLVPREPKGDTLVCPRCGSKPHRRPRPRYGNSLKVSRRNHAQ